MFNTPEKRDLFRLSNIAGVSLLAASLVLPALLMLVLPPEMPMNLVMIASGLLTLLPAALLGRVLLRPEERAATFALGKPHQNPVAVFFVGVAVCYLGNFVTAMIGALGSRAGVTFEGPQFAAPQSWGSLLMMLFAVAVLPGVLEEILLRGVIMQPLRQHGDWFAITCSAVLFALIHGNMQQAPMAFVAGLALGWAAIRCGGLLVPIAIHFWNNAASVLMLFLQGRMNPTHFDWLQLGYVLVIMLLGLAGTWVLWTKKAEGLTRGTTAMGVCSRTTRYFFGSVPMVLALAWFGYLIWLMTA